RLSSRMRRETDCEAARNGLRSSAKRLRSSAKRLRSSAAARTAWKNGCATSMSCLTGQSKDHGKASCEEPGDEEAGGPTTKCWEAKTFSFPVDFFPNLVTIDWDLRIPLPPE